MIEMEYSRKLPVYKDVDVLVVGAGPAGIAAAVSAARSGADTLLFDQYGCVGGAATMGMVGPFMSSFDSTNQEMVVRGVFKEAVDGMVKAGGAIDPKDVKPCESLSSFYKLGHAHVGPFEAESYKIICTKLIQDSGAKILLHTQFVDCIREGNRIKGIVIANKSGMSVIRAKEIIDCTGDADVAARSGVEFMLGAPDGALQSATLFFRVYNVNTEELTAHINEHKDEIKPFFGPFSWLIREKKEEWGIPRGEVTLFEGPEKGVYRLNVTRILDVDGTNAEDLTRAELEGLQQVHHVFDFLKKYAAGFENAKFMDTAGTVGIRESRHIEGLYKLKGDDVYNCRVPKDSIAVMATNMDTHNKDNPGGSFVVLSKGPYFGVPYACLVPKGIDNLLVAGRSISAESTAGSAIRMIPCCMAFGQAAGAAAAMAVKKSIQPAEVNPEELRTELAKQGAFVGTPNM
jgi:hypothetical protein